MQDNAEIITVIRALTLRFKKRPDGFVGRTGGRERDKTTDTSDNDETGRAYPHMRSNLK
jgi:hypothetical protein